MLPDVLGNRYLLQERLGEGGMGKVYCALDKETGQDVAIKILHGKLAKNSRSCKRFEREAKIAINLNYPGIVRVYAYGTDPRPYIVMEKLNGSSLRRYIRTRHLTPLAVLELSLQICDSLRYAHEHGIVHRDLKPDNIFVIHHDQGASTPTAHPEDHIKLLDFGLARMTKHTDMSVLTKQGTALGTCSYMAPEQASGKEADERSDLYSLGIILYEFTVGMTPFSADDQQSILYMQVHQKPEPPCEANPALPKPIGDLLLWILNKRPEDRPQTALQLKNKIEEILAYLHQNARLERPSVLPPDPSSFRNAGVKVNYRHQPEDDYAHTEQVTEAVAAPRLETPRDIEPTIGIELTHRNDLNRGIEPNRGADATRGIEPIRGLDAPRGPELARVEQNRGVEATRDIENTRGVDYNRGGADLPGIDRPQVVPQRLQPPRAESTPLSPSAPYPQAKQVPQPQRPPLVVGGSHPQPSTAPVRSAIPLRPKRFLVPLEEDEPLPRNSLTAPALKPNNIVRNSIDGGIGAFEDFDFPEVQFTFGEDNSPLPLSTPERYASATPRVAGGRPQPLPLPGLPPLPSSNPPRQTNVPTLRRTIAAPEQPERRCLVTMLYIGIEKFSHLCSDEHLLAELNESIVDSFAESVEVFFKGQLRICNPNSLCALYTGGQNGLRAAQTAQRIRRELAAIRMAFNLNFDFGLKVGVYSTEMPLTNDDCLRTTDEKDLRYYAERLASISRSEAQGATVINAESLDQRMQYSYLRSIFIGGGRQNAVYLHVVTALP